MPPLAMVVLPLTAYSTVSAASTAVVGQQQQQRQRQPQTKDQDQLQTLLQELQQGDLLDRCHASNSLVKDLMTQL